MIQNLIALTIVFSAAAFTVFSIIKSLTAKKASRCDGCAGCSFKEMPTLKHTQAKQPSNF
jgi:hypothetical protein